MAVFGLLKKIYQSNQNKNGTRRKEKEFYIRMGVAAPNLVKKSMLSELFKKKKNVCTRKSRKWRGKAPFLNNQIKGFPSIKIQTNWDD